MVIFDSTAQKQQLPSVIPIYRKPLPQPQKGLHVPTELDLLTAKRRHAELVFIARKANDLRLSATDVDEALNEVDGYLTLLRNMAVEVLKDHDDGGDEDGGDGSGEKEEDGDDCGGNEEEEDVDGGGSDDD